jgi:hypothetical protein
MVVCGPNGGLVTMVCSDGELTGVADAPAVQGTGRERRDVVDVDLGHDAAEDRDRGGRLHVQVAERTDRAEDLPFEDRLRVGVAGRRLGRLRGVRPRRGVRDPGDLERGVPLRGGAEERRLRAGGDESEGVALPPSDGGGVDEADGAPAALRLGGRDQADGEQGQDE